MGIFPSSLGEFLSGDNSSGSKGEKSKIFPIFISFLRNGENFFRIFLRFFRFFRIISSKKSVKWGLQAGYLSLCEEPNFFEIRNRLRSASFGGVRFLPGALRAPGYVRWIGAFRAKILRIFASKIWKNFKFFQIFSAFCRNRGDFLSKIARKNRFAIFRGVTRNSS